MGLKETTNRINTDSTHSNFKGILGWYESVFRKFQVLGSLSALLPVYAIGVVCFAIALTPGAYLFQWGYPRIEFLSPLFRAFALALLVSAAYVIFGFSLILVTPTLNFLLRTYPKSWRGPYHSIQTIIWGIHNVFAYIPRYTFLEFLTPTPFNILFYRLMGMKIGKGVQINTTNISDPSLIELGDRVTIGGSATLLAHYGQGGFLVIAPVKIGKGVTVGLKATIMGDVEIGEYAKILPNSAVLPKTRIPAGETWGGVPAVKVDLASQHRSHVRTVKSTRLSAKKTAV
jgi:carbonic anhydrase/acetyltransferase-like protein (isoleucine patch superfamily)